MSKSDEAVEKVFDEEVHKVSAAGATVKDIIEVLGRFDPDLPVCILASIDEEKELNTYDTVKTIFTLDGTDTDENSKKIVVIE